MNHFLLPFTSLICGLVAVSLMKPLLNDYCMAPQVTPHIEFLVVHDGLIFDPTTIISLCTVGKALIPSCKTRYAILFSYLNVSVQTRGRRTYRTHRAI